MKRRAPAILLLLLMVAGAIALVLTGDDYAAQDRNATMAPATSRHWTGTDELGRDRTARVAAALLIGTIAWWGFGGQFHAPGVPALPQIDSSPAPADNQAIAQGTASITPSPEELATAARLNSSLSNDAPSSDSSNTLSEAETQASLLVARSDSASVTSEISLAEGNP